MKYLKTIEKYGNSEIESEKDKVFFANLDIYTKRYDGQVYAVPLSELREIFVFLVKKELIDSYVSYADTPTNLLSDENMVLMKNHAGLEFLNKIEVPSKRSTMSAVIFKVVDKKMFKAYVETVNKHLFNKIVL